MRFIAHRGNVGGPIPALENDPSYLTGTMVEGYDVEVDVWQMPDGLWLGHDAPKYKIDRSFLQNRRVWSHCKNGDALRELSRYPDVNCFFQEGDEVVLTSRGFLWGHQNSTKWDGKTVLVNLKADDRMMKLVTSLRNDLPYAVCSDYCCGHLQTPPKPSLPFDLLIVDIDGVMTDGTKIYDREGMVSGKRYCDLDFTAIKRFWAAGIKVCFLSGDKTVNEAMAESRKVDFFHNPPGVDKVDVLPGIMRRYSKENVAYVGDDYYDIPIMSTVPLSFCPSSSPAPVKRAATHVVQVEAGQGVLAGIYDMFEDQIPYAFPKDSPDVNPK